MITYGHQCISQDDIDAVAKALCSDFLTQGPCVESFEKAFADRVGARHAIAVCNATAALHLCMRAASIGPGDRVLTSPITFLASANAAAYVGARPDFCDIDPVSATIDPESIEKSWDSSTKAIVAVDYAGQACDFPSIGKLAKARGAIVIEDACHATGGRFRACADDPVAYATGLHPWTDFGVFSFHPVKTVTTGEGGMIVTNNAEWASRLRRLRSHGMERDPSAFDRSESCELTCEHGPWYYEMQELGYNYRLTDIQCALGLSQLSQLDNFTLRRRQIVALYNKLLGGVDGIQRPGLRNPLDLDLTSWHLYTLQIDFARFGISRSDFMARMRAQGIGTQVLYIPVHLQPWYRKTYGYGPGKCPHAEAFYKRCISLPLYPSLSDEQVYKVVAQTKTTLGLQS